MHRPTDLIRYILLQVYFLQLFVEQSFAFKKMDQSFDFQAPKKIKLANNFDIILKAGSDGVT